MFWFTGLNFHFLKYSIKYLKRKILEHNIMMKMITKNFGVIEVHLHKRVTLQNMPIWRYKQINSLMSKFVKEPLTFGHRSH